MLDLDYGSDSDTEQTPAPVPVPPPRPPKPSSGLSALLPKPKSRKQRETSGADKDAPKKIVVNLPKIDDEGDEDSRPAKKARSGGGGSGLSALLPAPKRSGAAKKDAPPPPPPPPPPEPSTEEPFTTTATGTGEKKAIGSNTMFVPQSVARKPIQPMSAFRKRAASGVGAKPKAPKPQVSLFGAGAIVGAAPRSQTMKPVAAAEYKPIMIEAAQPMRRPAEETYEEPVFWGEAEVVQQSSYTQTSSVTQVQPANDLDSLAREAGLDEAAMRQLYGRRGPGKEPIKITTFSVDEEYRQNELEKKLGLAQEVKPVRTVAPGRHQLTSLLNVAQSQKSAYEDAFARGKQNKKEASSKYGW